MRLWLLSVGMITLFSSCLSYSRMTSPEIMDPTERAWTIGGQPHVWIDTYEKPNPNPQNPVSDDGSITTKWGFTPSIGFRSGSEIGEFGALIHQQAFTPAVTLDYKHPILQKGNFHFSGNIAGTLGSFPGAQYDLLFGSRPVME